MVQSAIGGSHGSTGPRNDFIAADVDGHASRKSVAASGSKRTDADGATAGVSALSRTET